MKINPKELKWPLSISKQWCSYKRGNFECFSNLKLLQKLLKIDKNVQKTIQNFQNPIQKNSKFSKILCKINLKCSKILYKKHSKFSKIPLSSGSKVFFHYLIPELCTMTGIPDDFNDF